MLNLNVYIFHFNLGRVSVETSANLSSREFTLWSDTTVQSCKIHSELEIHPEQMTQERCFFWRLLCTSTPRKWRREEVVSSPADPIVFLIVYSYISDRSVCVCVAQTLSSLHSKKNRDGRTEATGSALHMTTSHWGPLKPRIFVSPVSIRDCVSQLPGASCTPDMLFPVKRRHSQLSLLGLTLWLLNRNKKYPQTNSWALQSLQAKETVINDPGGARTENKDVLLKCTLCKISILSRAVVTTEDTEVTSSTFLICGF